MSDNQHRRNSAFLRALRIALIYALFSILWILFSDKTLLFFVRDIETLTYLQTIKGWCFVVISAAIIFALLHREIQGHIATKEKFQAIFDHHYQLTGLLSPEGMLISANPSALEFVDAEEKDVLGKYFWETPWWNHSPELQKTIKAAISQAAKGTFVRFEATHPGPDGKDRHVDFSINPVANEDGDIIYLVPEGRDISSLKEIENALVESQTLYREAQAIAHIGHWKFDFVNEKLEWSGELFRIYEINQDDFVASFDTFLDLVHPEDRDYVLKEFENSIQRKKQYKVEHRIQLPDGRIKHILEQGRTEYEKDGTPLIFIGTAQDISEKKEAEEKLLFTQHSVDHGSTPILWMGQDQKILYANEASCELFEYATEELLGEKGSIFHPEGTSEYWDKYTPRLKKIKTVSDEIELKKKGGKLFSAFFTCSFVEYMGRAHFVIHLYDLTEIKKTEEKLRQAQKLEAIGTLAGGIAHDFNNILSGVIGYTEIALDDQLPESSPARKSLEQVLTAGYRARDLVKQILTFSRQSDSQKLVINLASIVNEVLKLMRASLPANIEIKQSMEGDRFDITGDPTHIHQVITNLCTNAGYAMRNDGGILSVKLHTVEYGVSVGGRMKNLSAGAYVTLTVEDSGPGMNSTIVEKIFNPFFTTKPKEEGTGLGLSVVHGIIQEHGGEISVESIPGHGTTFVVHLPQTTTNPNLPERGNKPPLPKGSETILFVDDEEPIVSIYGSTLEKLGYRVEATTSSQEALRLFYSDPDKYDLVISDQTMPGMTGDQLAEEIMLIRPEIPIVLCTGFSHSLNMSEVKKLGIRKLLMKPISKQDLAVTVRKILDQISE